MKRLLASRWIKAPIFALCLGPLFLLGWRALTGRLGANPIELVTHSTGDWTIRFLLTGLAVTPLRKLLGWPELIRFRRMLGLFAFFYGVLHLTTYLWLDKFFDWPEILKDVVKRPFITAGDPQAWRRTLAPAAPAGVRERDRRSGPLLLAGQV